MQLGSKADFLYSFFMFDCTQQGLHNSKLITFAYVFLIAAKKKILNIFPRTFPLPSTFLNGTLELQMLTHFAVKIRHRKMFP